MKLHNPPKPRDFWNSPIDDYEILSSESCKLIFDESKIYFEETIQESEELTQRSLRFLVLLLPGFAAVAAFCISHQEKLKPLDSFDFMLLIGILGSIANCLYNLFRLISPKEGHYRGSKPEHIMRPEIFKLNNISIVEKALFVSEIERIQIKIERMEYLNSKRIYSYKEVIYSFNILIGIGIVLLCRSI